MKKSTLLPWAFALAVGSSWTAHGQGTIVFNNLDPRDGLVIVHPDVFGGPGFPLNQDLNFALLAGPNGVALQPIHVWLLSDGTALGINVAPGRFADPSGAVLEVPGIAPGVAATLQVVAWSGNYATATAARAAGAGTGRTMIWAQVMGTVSTPAQLAMPQLDVLGVPEPPTFSLLIAGALLLTVRARHFARQR